MPWGWARLLASWLLLAGCWLAQPAWAQGAAAAQTVVLRDQVESIDARGLLRVWVDPRGDATIQQVSAAAGRPPFRAAQPGETFQLGATSALWMHLRLQRGREQRQDWVLEFPMPVLDQVTVYQRDGSGWLDESAGDTLAVSHWAEPGRYPMFRIDLAPGETRDVYVRIRHVTAASFPVELVTVAANARHQQLEYLSIGVGAGALLVLILGCLVMGYVYRDQVFAWYAGYAALNGLAVASYTGAAAHLLWPRFGALGDAPMSMLACAAVGAAMLFVRNILGLRRRMPRADRVMLGLAAAGWALAVLPPLLPKSLSLPLVGAYLVLATLVAMLLSLAAWARGDEAARWVLAAYLPMAAALGVSVLRVFGWLPVSAGTQYAVVLAIAVEVPLLLLALLIRTRDRHGAQVREQALSTQDALTGLLPPHLFTDRLRQVVARYQRDAEGAAVMYIDLVNHARIRDYFGAAAAEHSLLRSVIKLRRLLRDVDTVARVGEARFGVILEGARSRGSVTERASRLVATGLMPLPGLKPDVTLQFHVAALMLNERPLAADEVETALAAQLARMSPRTRRPIRFVEAEQAPRDGADSSLLPADPEPMSASQFAAS